MRKSYISKTALKKLNPEVYERAALLIQAGQERDVNTGKPYNWFEEDHISGNDYCCHAIPDAYYQVTQGVVHGSGTDPNNYMYAFKEAFGPEGIYSCGGSDYPHHPFWNKVDRHKSREKANLRVTALTLMAAMVREAKGE